MNQFTEQQIKDAFIKRLKCGKRQLSDADLQYFGELCFAIQELQDAKPAPSKQLARVKSSQLKQVRA